MKGEEWFDQVVFGRATPKLQSCLGLYLSAEHIYLSEVRVDGGKPAVQRLMRLAIPQKAASAAKEPAKDAGSTVTRMLSSLNNELLGEPQRLEGVLKQAIAEFKSKSTHVVVSLSSQFGLLRYFTVPSMDRRFWNTAVPAEAKKHIPIPFGDLVYDFQARKLEPGPDKQARLGVLFGVIHKKNLDGLFSVLKKVELIPVGVELAPCSVERLWDTLEWPSSQAPPYAHLHLEGSEAFVIVSEGGWPILFRTIQLSQESSPGERRKVDLSGSAEFARKQLLASGPSRFRLSGTHRELAAWNQALSQEMESPVLAVESGKALGLKTEEWGTYVCLGAAMRPLVPSAVVLDMSQSGRISEEERGAAHALFSIVLAVSAMLGFIGMTRYAQRLWAYHQISSLRAKINQIPDFRGKSSADISDMLKSKEAKLMAVNQLVIPRLQVTHLFETLAEEIPDSVWLNGFSFEWGGSGGLHLQGHAMGASVIAEQDLVSQFREKLQQDPRFEKMFICGTPRMDTTPEKNRSGAAAASPEELANERENRSSFSLDCESLRGKI